MSEAGPTTPTQTTDGQLLQAFLEQRSGEAFAQIVRRHGGMVLGVCRAILRNSADAEDAAQAVFLALADRAASLTGHATLAGWLYRVAGYVAANARRAASARQRHEREAARMKPQRTPTQIDDVPSDLLHQAVASLPQKYRLALIHHHFEGHSVESAASLLGCSATAAGVRLHRARQMLRQRLARHGIACASGAVVAALATQQASAAPEAFVTSITQTAIGATALQPACAGCSSNAVALSKGALHMLFMHKLKMAAMVTLAAFLVGVVGIGTLVLAAWPGAPKNGNADGVVVSVDVEKATITVLRLDWKQVPPTKEVKTHPVAKDAKVNVVIAEGRKQQECKLSDIAPDDSVSLQLTADGTTVAAIGVRCQNADFTLKSTDPAKGTIVVIAKGKAGPVERTLSVADDATISLGDLTGDAQQRQRKLSDLIEGSPLSVQLSPKDRNCVMSILVGARMIWAPVQAVDENKRTITVKVEGKNQTFPVADQARILILDNDGEHEATISDMMGETVSLQLSISDQKTVTDIRVLKGKAAAEGPK